MVLFITDSWLAYSEIMGLPQRYDAENCSQLKGSLWKQSSIRHNGSRSLKKFHLEYPSFDSLLPYQRQSKNSERALSVLLVYLEAADDVTLKWALCSSREIAEVPCSSMVCWDQQRVPITQPHSTATQIPAATRVKGHQVAVQGWSKEPKGSWGTRST